MTLRGGIPSSSDNHKQSVMSDLNYPRSRVSQYLMNNNLDVIQDEEIKTVKQSQLIPDKFGASTSQMKSLMKSFSNGNFEFFDNLHKKYFDNAREKSQNSSKPPTSSQINLDKSDKDLFTLTSKTNTLLGISQFKSSLDSFKKSQDKPSILRASSLGIKRNNNKDNQRNAMSINFKNSLYKKINPSNEMLDDNSQS